MAPIPDALADAALADAALAQASRAFRAHRRGDAPELRERTPTTESGPTARHRHRSVSSPSPSPAPSHTITHASAGAPSGGAPDEPAPPEATAVGPDPASQSGPTISGGSEGGAPAPSSSDLTRLVEAARSGDAAAWDAIVDRFSLMVWRVSRSVGLGQSDAADVCQTTWLRLVLHLDAIKQPECIGGWLATTARREAIRTHQRHSRNDLVGDDGALDRAGADEVIDLTDSTLLHDAHVSDCLSQAISMLPDRSRMLMTLLVNDAAPSYAEIGRMLDMPIGSIGPTRARALATLRSKLDDFGITADDVLDRDR